MCRCIWCLVIFIPIWYFLYGYFSSGQTTHFDEFASRSDDFKLKLMNKYSTADQETLKIINFIADFDSKRDRIPQKSILEIEYNDELFSKLKKYLKFKNRSVLYALEEKTDRDFEYQIISLDISSEYSSVKKDLIFMIFPWYSPENISWTDQLNRQLSSSILDPETPDPLNLEVRSLSTGYLILQDEIHRISINLTVSLSFSQNTLFFSTKIPELSSQILRIHLSGSSGEHCFLNISSEEVSLYSMTYFYLFFILFEITLETTILLDKGRTRDNYRKQGIIDNLNPAQVLVIAILVVLALYRVFWVCLLYQIKVQSWFQQFLRLTLFIISIYRICMDTDKVWKMSFLEIRAGILNLVHQYYKRKRVKYFFDKYQEGIYASLFTVPIIPIMFYFCISEYTFFADMFIGENVRTTAIVICWLPFFTFASNVIKKTW
jgi:hypothetical protein